MTVGYRSAQCSDPRTKAGGRVILQHRNLGLGDDRAAVQFFGDEMHAGTVFGRAGIQGALVRVEATECRQQRGMNVDQSPVIMRTNAGVRMRMKPASTTSAG